MLSNEEVNLKLANLTGEMSLVTASLARMERTLEGFVVHSRTIAELVIQNDHTQQAIKQLRADNEDCADTHSRVTADIDKRLSATTASVNEIRSMTRGAIFAGGAFTSLATALVFAAASYIFNQVSKNSDTNLIQQQRIEQLERALPKRETTSN